MSVDIKHHNLLVVVGATASGKTRLAVELARRYGGEVISADSRQVYRGLDIGSGKDLAEYGEIPYHLIDIVDPGYEFNVFEYQRRFIDCFEALSRRNTLPILAGGSALYVDAVLRGYRLIEVAENPVLRKKLEQKTHEELAEYLLRLKPRQHNTTDLLDRNRLVRAIEIAEGEREKSAEACPYPEIKPLILGIHWERTELRARITARLRERLDAGLIEEVQQLHASGVSWSTLDFYGLEYRFVGQYLRGELSENDLFQKLNSAIHKFAKKQDTWLRRMQRNDFTVHWLDARKDLYAQARKVLD